MKGDFRRRAAMTAFLALMLSLPAPAPAPAAKVDILFTRVAPAGDKAVRSKDQTRAVILIHGLSLWPILRDRTKTKLTLRTWQQADSVLVKQLTPHADVYAFAYSQSTSVEKIHES